MGSPTLFGEVRDFITGWGCTALTGAIVSLFILAGCSTIPDAQVSYYQTKTQITIKVTRSVLCDQENLPHVANTVIPSVTHSADLMNARSLRLTGLRSAFTDSDVKIEFYEDGRLKTINATQTGQGEVILKAATTLSSTLTAFVADSKIPAFPNECAFVKKIGGDKPLTLTYEGTVNPSKTGRQDIEPDAASAAYADKLKSAISGICVVVKDAIVPEQPVQYKANDGDVLIVARQPAQLNVEVGTQMSGNGCSTEASAALWRGRIPIAQLGKEYQLPLPSSVAFGKLTLGAAFAESGAITSVQYVSNSGVTSALGATNSLATIAQGEATSATATRLKAEADLIAQQQRLLQCQADPKSCK